MCQHEHTLPAFTACSMIAAATTVLPAPVGRTYSTFEPASAPSRSGDIVSLISRGVRSCRSPTPPLGALGDLTLAVKIIDETMIGFVKNSSGKLRQGRAVRLRVEEIRAADRRRPFVDPTNQVERGAERPRCGTICVAHQCFADCFDRDAVLRG